MLYADVILPLPLHDTFTYAVPEDMKDDIKRGCRVVVPFGPKKVYTAVVCEVHDRCPDFAEVKSVVTLLDKKPVVTDKQFEFWRWIADYYICSVGEVFNAALPGGMKPKDGDAMKADKKRRRTKSAVVGDLSLQIASSVLSEAQSKAYEEICDSFTTHNVTLLHGVTSSGKTEIYIKLIKKTISEGKQVLYMLPEIALTTQITDRLNKVFGGDMCVYHSKFTDTQRVRVYQGMLEERPPMLVLGVRSSVFLPFTNLGLVIVDEEHETSYKQQEPAPRYNGRNAALVLARMYGASVLLGTATPSFEVYHLARKGRYGYVQLTKRYNDVRLPEIQIVDVKELRRKKLMKGPFSDELVTAMRDAVSAGEQVILFQNRRGYSNFIECKCCGWVPRCEHCDVSLTYHKESNQMTCHYCGRTYAIPDVCPACEEKRFINKGLGTEKVEDLVISLMPEARVLRMDLDTTRSRLSYETIISQFADHQADVLVGTQMVTKGLDFDNVSVVGILDADTMLNQPDFRSYERAFHTLSQVAGRAGRRGRQGRVILQTHSADTDIIRQIVNNDFWGMFYDQMQERKLFNYPPFFRLINVFLRHRENNLLEHLSEEMAMRLRTFFGDKVLGPDSPPVGRIKSMYIRKIMIKVDVKAPTDAVRSCLSSVRDQMLSQTVAHGLTIYYDVDPM